jgi:hypothetical protein
MAPVPGSWLLLNYGLNESIAAEYRFSHQESLSVEHDESTRHRQGEGAAVTGKKKRNLQSSTGLHSAAVGNTLSFFPRNLAHELRFLDGIYFLGWMDCFLMDGLAFWNLVREQKVEQVFFFMGVLTRLGVLFAAATSIHLFLECGMGRIRRKGT